MNKKTIKTAISIGRDSRDEVHIRIECRNSSNEFVDVKLSYEEFARALTGLSMVDCEAVVKGLDVVGKVRVREGRTTECPLNTYDKEELKAWMVGNCQEDSWELSTYLGSQNSIKWVDSKTILNYSVTKYVDPEGSVE